MCGRVEFERNDAIDGIGDAWPLGLFGQSDWICPRCRAMNGASLTRRTERLAVSAVRLKSARLNVRRHPGIARLGQWRERHDQLRHHRQHGE